MNIIKKLTLSGICLVGSALHALPIEMIHKQGEYLKGLITQVKLEQFKKDSALFFVFFPQFSLPEQQMLEYKKIATALLDHANMTRTEKFEERKLLLGSTIHNSRALGKSIALGITTLIGITGSVYAFSHTQTDAKVIGLLGLFLTGLCAYGTRHYYKRAINGSDLISQQMQELLLIIDHAKQVNARLNTPEEPRA